MTILWWHWLVLGLLLVVAEMATPGGFYIIFFGVGALIVGGLASYGLAGPLWAQVVLFAVLSVVLLAVFRARLLALTQVDPQMPAVDTLIGEIAVAAANILPDAVGTVELHGSRWSARNASVGAIDAGTRCVVLRVDGLMVHVEPEGGRS